MSVRNHEAKGHTYAQFPGNCGVCRSQNNKLKADLRALGQDPSTQKYLACGKCGSAELCKCSY